MAEFSRRDLHLVKQALVIAIERERNLSMAQLELTSAMSSRNHNKC